MTKLAAILLLTLHLFNLGGYQILFSKAEQAAAERFLTRLDRSEYTDQELIEVKIPVNLPYQSNWSDFERYDGEVQIGAVHYKYVKRKLYNDTMILMCIPNPEQMKIANAKEAFFSLVNNLQHPGQEKSPGAPSKIIKSITTEYIQDNTDAQLAWEVHLPLLPAVVRKEAMPQVFLPTPFQPPEMLA